MERFGYICNWIVAVTILLGGCAATGGISWKETQANLKAPAANQGRLFIYANRGTAIGLSSDILLDGMKIGTKASGEIIIVDTPAGAHELSMSTEAEVKTTFHINSGEKKYFLVKMAQGILVARLFLEGVDPKDAERDLQDNAPYFEWVVQKSVL